MAKAVTLTQEINGVEHTVYPQTIPSQVVNPETGRSMEELWNLDRRMYEVVVSLPLTNIQEGKLYLIQTSTPGTYTQYVWNGVAWTNLGNAAINLVVEDTLNSSSTTTGLAANQGRELKYMITGVKVVSANEYSEHYKDGYQLKADSSQVGKNIDDVPTFAQEGRYNIKIPLAGIKSARFWEYNSTAGYGSLVIDANGKVLAAYTNSPGADITITVSSDAEYLVLSTTNPDALVTLRGESSIPFPEGSESGSGNIVLSGSRLLLKQGDISVDGALDDSSTKVTSEAVFGEHAIELNSDYRFHSASLFDRKGNMVAYQYLNPNLTWSANISATKSFISTGKHHPDYGYRYVIKRLDGGDILPTDNIFKRVVMMEDAGLHRWIPDDIAPFYKTALHRAAVLQNLFWIPVAKAPEKDPTVNQYFHRAGEVVIGPPYSDCANVQKYVPQDVSVRTFLSAASNKRSLLYTEDLYAGTSGYGISYSPNTYARCFFGAVCSSYTGWVMGNPIVRISADYHDLSIAGMSKVADPTEQTIDTAVKPLDFLWKDGHVMVIMAVWKDEFGATKYIELTEMSSTSRTWSNLLTVEQFLARFAAQSQELLRYSNWSGLQEPDDLTKSLVPIERGDAIQRPAWNPDIMTFAGDYATFKTTDVMVLNARRAETYTKVNLYKDGSTTPTEIDITGLSVDGSDGEDWVRVVLTGQLNAGKYEARLSDGTNETQGTFFEVLDLSISASYTPGSLSLTFSAVGGTPLYVNDANNNGFPKHEHIFTQEEASGGSATLSWTRNNSYTRLKFVIQGDYGTATMFITFPSA